MSLAGEARALWGEADRLDVASLTHNRANGVTQSVERVRAGAQSAVVKVLSRRTEGVPTHWLPSEDPTHYNYWRREALVYRDELADAYAGSGLVAPRLLALHERTDGSISLWLEDLGWDDGEWTVDDVVTTARMLGVAQGRLAVEGRPDQAWLSRRYLRRYSSARSVDHRLLDDDERWAHPLVARHDPGSLRKGTRALHEEADWFFDVSERLPRTFCHLDFWPANLAKRTDGTVAAVDWSFAGDGALGEDVSNLIVDSVFDHFLSADDLVELDERVVAAYVDGLSAAGWDGDDRLVRLGVWSAAVKFQWLMPFQLAHLDEPTVAYGGEPAVDPDRRYADRLGGLALLVEWAERARRLARVLGW